MPYSKTPYIAIAYPSDELHYVGIIPMLGPLRLPKWLIKLPLLAPPPAPPLLDADFLPPAEAFRPLFATPEPARLDSALGALEPELRRFDGFLLPLYLPRLGNLPLEGLLGWTGFGW